MRGAPDDAAGLRAANARLRRLVAERDAEITRLRAQVAETAALGEQVAQLQGAGRGPGREGAAELEELLQATVAGWPGEAGAEVAADEDRAQTRRPEGQPGATMQLSDHPDHVVRHEPACCAGCGRGLTGAQEAAVIRRQVMEIPPVKAEVTEHQMIGRLCGCGILTWGKPRRE